MYAPRTEKYPLTRYSVLRQGRLAQWESTAFTTESRRARDQDRFAKYLLNA